MNPQLPINSPTNNETKPIRALVLDAAPFLTHAVPPTSLLSRAEKVYTTPAVLAEIRDPQARARLDTQWLPFITPRKPKAESIRIIIEMARKTGDKEVLSGADIGVLALAFELECEHRGGDWWRRTDEDLGKKVVVTGGVLVEDQAQQTTEEVLDNMKPSEEGAKAESLSQSATEIVDSLQEEVSQMQISRTETLSANDDGKEGHETDSGSEGLDDDSGGEWITPTNIDKFRKEKNSLPISGGGSEERIFTACATSDFAMQNILLLLPITLISPTDPNMRIRCVKTWLLRCHACFFITRVMSHQFCPRCGGATLLRTSCSTDAETGKTTIYLKKNFQWNVRGNVYPIPKPTGGRANGKEGNGVRHELVLRADQKEYVRKREEVERRTRKGQLDLMSEDYLPSILTGERRWGKEKVRVGYGKQNSNERRKTGGRKK